MSAAVTLELLAEIAGFAGPGQRALGRDAAGAWYLVELTAGGERRCLSGPVTVESAFRDAIAILGGDDRTISKSQARLGMAVLIAGICFLDLQTAGGAAPPAPSGMPPGDAPPAPGGDLFTPAAEGPKP